MNNTITLQLAHRSIRKFTAEPIEEAVLTTLLDVARSASSSSFLQCVSIIRISDSELRAKLAHLAGDQAYINEAAEFLVFCADFDRHAQLCPELQFGFSEQFAIGCVDVGIMAQNLLIGAQSLGLGAVYIGGIRNQLDAVAAALQLPDKVLPIVGMCLGYPDQHPEQKPRLPQTLLVHQNAYQRATDPQLLAEYDEVVRSYYQTRSNGKINHSWSEQICATLSKELRPKMLSWLQARGWLMR